MNPSVDDLKRLAAEEAVRGNISDGMALGLGSGSTAAHVVRVLGLLLADGSLRDIVGVPTSERTDRLAREVGVPLTTLDEHPHLAVGIDGADEVAPGLDLIKGLGGALLREKVVAGACDRFVVVADASKVVGRLGERAPVPVETIPFATSVCARALARLGCEPVVRRTADRSPFVTDEGNRILDCRFPSIDDPERLDVLLRRIPGVVEHGLFIGMATEAYIAGERGVERRVL